MEELKKHPLGDSPASVWRFEEFVGPGYEVFPVRAVSMSAVVLTPGELAVEQSGVDGRHLRGAIIVRYAEVLRTEQPEHRLGRHRRHEAAPVVQPFRVALFRHA